MANKKEVKYRSVLVKEEAQALANFLWNERERHLYDIAIIESDLARLIEKWGVRPKKIREFVVP